MATSFFSGQTLDDLMRDVIGTIQSDGDRINPSQGECKELRGVILELTNPRARLSRTETRGKPFSCLGEFCWYMAGSNELEFISYYIDKYKRFAEGKVIFGAYGPRLFGSDSLNQVANVTDLLRRKPDSRQAVIQLFDGGDIAQEHKDVPCTCALQFMIRADVLHMVTFMRSNDTYLGLPHDIFSFTMLQEMMARALSVGLGTYKHAVGSLHLYDRNLSAAQQFLEEGWQPTDMSMPPMPLGDPWPSIQLLLKAEATIRKGQGIDIDGLQPLDSYWKDLIRLLQVLRCWRDEECDRIAELRDKMSSSIYEPFIDQKFKECQRRSAGEPVHND